MYQKPNMTKVKERFLRPGSQFSYERKNPKRTIIGLMIYCFNQYCNFEIKTNGAMNTSTGFFFYHPV